MHDIATIKKKEIDICTQSFIWLQKFPPTVMWLMSKMEDFDWLANSPFCNL